MLNKSFLLEYLLNSSSDLLIFFDSSLQIQEMNLEARKTLPPDTKNIKSIDFFKELNIENLFLDFLREIDSGNDFSLPTTIFSRNNKEYVIHWNITALPKKYFSERLFLLKGVSLTKSNKFSKNAQDLNPKTITPEQYSNLSQAQTLKEISKEVMGFDIYPDQSNKIKQLLVFLRAIVANMPGNVYWKDVNSVYMGGNNNVVNVCNLSSRAEIAGLTDSILEKKLNWETGTAARFRKDDIEVINSKKPRSFEDHFSQADGTEVVMFTTKTPIFDDNDRVTGILATSLDITRLKQQEAILQKAKEKAEIANKLKTEFMENMQHDVRTPVSGIYSALEMLIQANDHEQNTQTLPIIAKSAKELLELCNDVIYFEDLERGHHPFKLKKINIYDVTSHIVDLNATSAKDKNIQLLLHIHTDVPKVVTGDVYRIKKILTNLVGNSIKFTKTGTVELTVKLLEKHDNKASIQFIVSDTGIGIPENKIGIIFEKFTRLNPSNQGLYKGSGLGLSFVKKFVDEIGGHLEVKSQLNVGTQFLVTLPFLIPMKNASIKQKKLEQEAASAKQALPLLTTSDINKFFANTSVLIIEDQLLASMVAQRIFENIQCTVTIAKNVAEALAILNSQKFDLVISDIGLPDGTGFDIVRACKENYEAINFKTPFFALTAHSTTSKNQQCIDAGFAGMISKPIQAEIAEKILQQYIIKEENTHMNNDVISTNSLTEPPMTDGEIPTEMLQILMESLSEARIEITHAFQNNDLNKLTQAMHKLYGGLCYTRTPQLREAARELELAAKGGNTNKIPALYHALLKAIDRFEKAFAS